MSAAWGPDASAAEGTSLCAAPAEDALDPMDVRAAGPLPRVPHDDERHRPEKVTLIAGRV